MGNEGIPVEGTVFVLILQQKIHLILPNEFIDPLHTRFGAQSLQFPDQGFDLRGVGKTGNRRLFIQHKTDQQARQDLHDKGNEEYFYG